MPDCFLSLELCRAAGWVSRLHPPNLILSAVYTVALAFRVTVVFLVILIYQILHVEVEFAHDVLYSHGHKFRLLLFY